MMENKKEVIATCENCEKEIYEGEEYHQDDGDCDFCDACWKEWMEVIRNCKHKVDKNTLDDEIQYCIKCSGQMPVKKEHPILFSTPMVRAITSGQKTMTRRAKGFGEVNEMPDRFVYVGNSKHMEVPHPAVKYDRSTYYMFNLTNSNGHSWVFKCPYGEIGDRIWVRETFRPLIDCENGEFKEWDYKADMPDEFYKQFPQKGYKPSIHMPRKACRILLEITEIKIERLQDISEDDAKAEGAKDHLKVDDLSRLKTLDWTIPSPFQMHQLGFLAIWCDINGVQSWKENPWVWVIKFKRIQK